MFIYSCHIGVHSKFFWGLFLWKIAFSWPIGKQDCIFQKLKGMALPGKFCMHISWQLILLNILRRQMDSWILLPVALRMFYSRYWEDIWNVCNSSVFFSFVSFYCVSSQSRSHIFKFTRTSNQIPGWPTMFLFSHSPLFNTGRSPIQTSVSLSTSQEIPFKRQSESMCQLFTGEEVEELTTFCAVIGIFLQRAVRLSI